MGVFWASSTVNEYYIESRAANDEQLFGEDTK